MNVPLVEIGEPETVRMVEVESATDVTVPVPAVVSHDGFAAAPPLWRTWPAVPGARNVQPDAPWYRMSPCVLSKD